MNEGRNAWSNRLATGLAIVLAVGACERKRPIVKMVETAGAGDLRTASVGSIVQWFQKHPALAIKTDNLCVPLRNHAQAKWPETTEGRVCNAAARVAGFIVWQRDIQANNDYKTFQGGSR
jgi:hypothetical protein